MNSILSKLTVSNAVIFVTTILGALSAFGQVPHANQITSGSGWVALVAAAAFATWKAMPHAKMTAGTAALDALHLFAENLSNDVTPDQKAALIAEGMKIFSPPAASTTAAPAQPSPVTLVSGAVPLGAAKK
jgi:ABC-type uncharacterized transport system permease subunit